MNITFFFFLLLLNTFQFQIKIVMGRWHPCVLHAWAVYNIYYTLIFRATAVYNTFLYFTCQAGALYYTVFYSARPELCTTLFYTLLHYSTLYSARPELCTTLFYTLLCQARALYYTVFYSARPELYTIPYFTLPGQSFILYRILLCQAGADQTLWYNCGAREKIAAVRHRTRLSTLYSRNWNESRFPFDKFSPIWLADGGPCFCRVTRSQAKTCHFPATLHTEDCLRSTLPTRPRRGRHLLLNNIWI